MDFFTADERRFSQYRLFSAGIGAFFQDTKKI
jgi:hypothetical protein